MLKFKYGLTEEGVKRCTRDEFYLQGTSTYKGYTERIFRVLHRSEKPLTTIEISNLTGIKTSSVNGIIAFNVYAGYVRRIQLQS
jgi:hypothetical protein